ncbi:MAG: Gfo/Idh/MocA family oxidoreductase [Alphaproteobacteria bacterium]|nr:Gfo/Idh/MocA family oxidoreductase [Alphaproteobacteria bacterium]
MINVAVAGLGWWGREHVRSLEHSDKARVIRAVDPDEGTARPFAEDRGLTYSTGLDDALCDENVDALILATPHSLHTEQIIACAQAGKHVFTEKPFAMSVDDARRQVDAVRDADVQLGIGLIQRFAPPHLRMKDMLDAGELGAPLHGEGNVSHDVLLNVTSWRKSADEAPAGGIHHTGTHLIDLYIWMLGPVREVYARIASHVFENDTASALLTFESGTSAYIGDVMATAEQRYFHLFASEGWARRTDETKLVVRRRGCEPQHHEFDAVDLVRANNEAFADAVTGHAPYPISMDDMVHNVAVLDAIARSIRENRPMPVEPRR